MSQADNPDMEESDIETCRDLVSTSFEHDINNLANLAGGYRQLAETADTPEEEKQFLEKAEQAEKRVDRMYDRLESCPLDEDKSLQEILGHSLETLRPKIQKEDKNISIYWNSSSYDCQSCVMTERMIYNLLDNSLDHGDEDIELEIEQLDEYVQLELSDGGALTEEEFNELFCQEYQEDEYLSTGSYVIDTLAHKIDAEIEHSETADYTIKIPANEHN